MLRLSNHVLCFLACLLITAVASAQRPRTDSPTKALEKREFKTASGRTLRYAIFYPIATDTDTKYPLVITLHGIGGRGAQNWERNCYANTVLAKPEMRTKYPCFVVAPTCDKPSFWAGEPLAAVFELIDRLQKVLPIDPDRIYVTGQSMGGYGTFAAIVQRPNLFAAAVPVCGGNKSANAPKIAHVPIWVFHGAKDGTVPVARSREMVEAIEKAGGKPKYTEFPTVGHAAWTPAYENNDLWEWIFNQRHKHK
jgi:predicted peptidase